MIGFIRTVLSQDGTTIAFDQAGDGPSIILVGGALSTRSASAPLAALLAPHFTVVAYDRRGRGDSGDTAAYAVQALVDVLPHAQRRTLDGQTHAVAPDALAPVLEEFFAG